MGQGRGQTLIRFLFDECITPRLIVTAREHGYDATHVNYRGFIGFTDAMLVLQILGGDFTLVTNNRRDFLKLYKPIDAHSELLIILPSVPATEQIRLFEIALASIAARATDLINELVEVDRHGAVTFSRYPFDGDNG